MVDKTTAARVLRMLAARKAARAGPQAAAPA